MMRLLVVVVIVIAAAAACRRPDPAEWTISVERVQSPAGADSSAPQLSATDQGLLVSWLEQDGPTNVLKFAEYTGAGWRQPIVAASGTGWFLSYAEVPSVLRKRDGTLVAQWPVTTEAKFEGYDLHLSYSKDGGKTWAPSFTPHHDGKKFQHGFASFFDLPDNGLGVVWLDGRNSEFVDNDPTSGTMTMRYASFDANWKQTADVEIDRNVCECCSTTAAVTSDGPVVAYRDRTDKEIRDIVVSRLEGGKWTNPAPVHNDNWEIYACPVNGPAVSARGRDAVAAWFTAKNDMGQTYAAFSRDGGRTWGAPIRLDDGASVGRVDVELLDDGTAVASWVEYRKNDSEFRVRLIDPSGMRSGPVTVADVPGGPGAGFPRMARYGEQLIFAWSGDSGGESGDAPRISTAVATLP
jgi:hypothetical protein